MALALKDRVKETTIVVGTGSATLLGSSIGFQPFSVVGNGNTTYYCISDQFGSNWEVGIGTYSSSGNTLARTTVLASSNGGALVVFTAGVKDVFVTYPAEKGVWLDASNNAIGLGTPAAFVGTNITGTASGLTAGNVTTNANLTGAVTSSGNATSLGSFTSLQLATALTDETGSGSAVFATSPTLANPTYTGTLTGSTGILNIGSGQLYKDASGNVGIGTTNPLTKLNVVGAIYSSITAVPSYILDSVGSHYGFIQNDSSNTWSLSSGTSRSTLGTPALTWNSSGNVVIGTSSPSSFGRLTISQPALVDTTTKREVFIDAPANTTTNTAGALNGITFRMNSSSYGSQFNRTSGVYGINTDTDAGGLYGRSAGLVFYTSSIDATATEKMRIDSSGNLLVGVTASIGGLNAVGHFKNVNAGAAGIVVGNAGGTSTTNTILFTNSNGTVGGISTSGSATAFNTSSDYRLKNTITPMTGALDKVVLLKPVTYKWIVDGSDGQGFIAHELAEVCPYAVTGEKDAVDKDGKPKYQGIDTSFLVATLTAAIQEQQTLIESLTERLTALENK